MTSETHERQSKQLARLAMLLAALLVAIAVILAACSAPGESPSSAEMPDASDKPAEEADLSTSTPSSPVCYPTGWLAVDAEGVPAGTPVSIMSLPDIPVTPHRDGVELSSEEQQAESSQWPQAGAGEALIEYGGKPVLVDADLLLVNLPDVMPGAVYDIVYSYASTSRCAGRDIPGVTGQRLEGYADGMQQSAYWNEPGYAVPCAYGTAVKALQVERALEARGYRLLVFDAYRPMTAQYYLSDAFAQAFYDDPVMQESLGDWALEWYVASGPSGHNFGTDLDVGVADANGNPLPMPSHFDAFDETGRLTDYPIDSGSISPDDYRSAVLENDACMALHEAFAAAGFSELASEWWHFGDSETEWAVREIAGPDGLDFVAML